MRSGAPVLAALVTAFGAVAAGCTPVTFPDPVIERLVPTFVVSGQQSTIQVTGQHFFGTYDLSFRTGQVDADQRFEGYISDGSPGAVQFRAVVTRVSDTRLVVRVDEPIPALPDGKQLLTLQTPGWDGRPTTVSTPIRVLPRSPQELRLSPAAAPSPANEPNTLEIDLLDVDGQSLDVITPVCLWDGAANNGSLVPLIISGDGDGADCPPLANGTPTVQANTPLALFEAAEPGIAQVRGYVAGLTPRLANDLDSSILIQSGTPHTIVINRGEPFTALVPEVDVQVDVLDIDGLAVPLPVQLTTVELICNDTGRTEGQVVGITIESGDRVRLSPVTSPCEDAEVVVRIDDLQQTQQGRINPGPRFMLDVVLEPLEKGPLEAGDFFDLLVTPQDEYGNETSAGDRSFAENLVVEASSLMPDGSQPVVQTDDACSFVSPKSEKSRCTVYTRHAIDDEVFTVRLRQIDTEGSTLPIQVLPAEDVSTVQVSVANPFEAGTAGAVWVLTRDEFGNVQDPLQKSFTLRHDLGDAVCETGGTVAALGLEFGCTLEKARLEAQLTVTADGLAEGESPTFTVLNGPLSDVRFTDVPDSVVAGASAAVSLAGFDAWGNPYIEQSDADIELVDASGTWSVDEVTLDGMGTARVEGFFTKEGSTFLTASQGSGGTWESPRIDVVAAETSGFVVGVDVPWAYIGRSAPAKVESVDAYGNRTMWSGTVTLESRATTSPDVSVSVINGVGSSRYTWTRFPSFTDVLDVVSAPWAGSSPAVVVIDECTNGQPQTTVSFGGHGTGVVCSDATTGVATVSVDLSGSNAGAGLIIGYAASVDDAPAVFGTTSTLDVVLAEGGYAIEGMVIDEYGCANVASADAWVGPDDGTPVGPIDVVASDDIIDSNLDSVTIDIEGAEDCTRTTASGQSVRVRSTAGSLVGPISSGSGLEVTLDAAGDASFTVETSGGLSDGIMEVHAWSDDGVAGGQVDVTVEGDDIPPVVVSQTPLGPLAAGVDEVELQLSEPIDGASLDATSFSLTGPAAVGIDAVVVESPGDRIRVLFDALADGTLGTWWLTAENEDVADASSNMLSGDWSGSAVDYEGAFGGVSGTVDSVTCQSTTPQDATFRPDGDDGLAVEADGLDITVDSASAPAWWVVDVANSAGARVFYTRLIPGGATDVVSWDGRGFDGMVVPNGTYTVLVRPDDGLGNTAPGCTVQAVVDNALGVVR